MKTSTTQHAEVTLDLGTLPRPSADPKVVDLARKLEAAEQQARADVGELAEARRSETEAADAYTSAVEASNERTAASALKILEAGGARVTALRARARITGALVDRLREEHAAAVAAAMIVVTGVEWNESRTALEASAKALEEGGRRVRGQLAAIDAMARDLTATPRPVLHTVRFLTQFRQGAGKTGGASVFNPGEIASFLPPEAAEIVRAKAAVYVDPWRGLGDARA